MPRSIYLPLNLPCAVVYVLALFLLAWGGADFAFYVAERW